MMTMLLGIVAVVLVPYIVVLLIALAGDRIAAYRDARFERQIAVTDALHREIGSVVAPVVEKRPWGPWRVLITVPVDHPGLVGRIVDVAHHAMADTHAQPAEIVLVPAGR